MPYRAIFKLFVAWVSFTLVLVAWAVWPSALVWVYAHEALASGLLAFSTGLLAVGAAVSTIRVLRRQITEANTHHTAARKQAEDHFKQERKRKFEAARAMLQFTLVSICRYADDATLFSMYGLSALKDEKGETQFPSNQPSLPLGEIAVLRDLIEYGDGEITNTIYKLLSLIQVTAARIEGLPGAKVTLGRDGGQTLHTVHQFVIATLPPLELYCLAGRTFDYARGRTNCSPVPTTKAMMQEHLFVLKINEFAFPEIYASLPEDASPHVDPVNKSP